ncbi:PoNe immunity protein domain-containing protein, partial [Defluviitalea phaphyphila]|uniref:PoNe immunity protein domain-containing protein n=1 Tax=Defluviitalea phaphyphila TaxID=1473580 RepID=UPI000A771D7E
MVRDKFKTFEDFEEEIVFAEQSIEEWKDEIKLLKEDIKNGIQRYPRDNEEIIRVTYQDSVMYEFRKIRAMYSAGMPIEDLVEDVEYTIFCIENYFEFEDTCIETEYIYILWLISLEILLETDKNNIKRLANIVEKWGIEDFVIDYLLCVSDIG